MTFLTIVFAILLFSLLIFIHELGHFLAAKAFKVQVNEFALFMGPALFKKQVGETLYSIRCIPIGGYCAMEGEDADTENPRSFQKASWWKRLIILVAGAFMNFVIGFILMVIVFAPNKSFLDPVIILAEPGCTVVSEEGLHVGDRFLQINGENVYTASDVSMLLSMGGTTHDIVVERDGQKLTFNDYEMKTHTFKDENGNPVERYGFSFGSVENNFGTLMAYSWNTSLDVVRSVRLSLQMIFTGQAGLSDMSGPIGIVQMMTNTAQASETAALAFRNMLYFGGFIAINLGVMNLLPIPALDGGRCVGLILTTIIERITKKKLDPKYEGYIHAAGMVLLLILMAVIMFKDIFTIFKG